MSYYRQPGAPASQTAANVMLELFDTFGRVVASIPKAIVAGTIDISNAVATKLHELGDAFKGGGSGQKTAEFVQMEKIHYDFLQKIRKDNKKKYNELLLVMHYYNQLPPNKQNELLALYFGIKRSSSRVIQEESRCA